MEHDIYRIILNWTVNILMFVIFTGFILKAIIWTYFGVLKTWKDNQKTENKENKEKGE